MRKTVMALAIVAATLATASPAQAQYPLPVEVTDASTGQPCQPHCEATLSGHFSINNWAYCNGHFNMTIDEYGFGEMVPHLAACSIVALPCAGPEPWPFVIEEYESGQMRGEIGICHRGFGNSDPVYHIITVDVDLDSGLELFGRAFPPGYTEGMVVSAESHDPGIEIAFRD